MNVSQIYEKFSTPKNLREHMLRVAAVAKIITDNWTGKEIDTTAVMKACAIHDLAKPINFDASKQSQYGMSFEEIAGLTKLKDFIKNKYGTDEHKAVVEISKDFEAGEKVAEILGNEEWENVPRLIKDNDIESLLAIYSDMRVGPRGILSVQDRIDNLNDRRGKKYPEYLENAEMLEPIIKQNVNMDLDSITDEQLNSLFDELRKLEI